MLALSRFARLLAAPPVIERAEVLGAKVEQAA